MFNLKKDDTLLVGAIFLVFVILLVGANFSGITGQIVKERSTTTLLVSPQVVSVGQPVYVTVIPGPGGVNQKTSFYQAEDNLRKISVDTLCNQYICKQEGSLRFIIPSHWEYGVYYVKVYDYASQTFVVEDFTVVN